jgi:ParB/RepB/Spo0J family partition protein
MSSAAVASPPAAASPHHVLQPTVLVSALTAFKLNPRKHFDAKAMQELTDSVKAQGVVQAIVVRPNGKAGTYEIVAGERRWRAAKAAGLAEIPATIRELTDAQALELAVIENNQRENLHPLEEAEGYEALLKQKHANLSKYTVEDLMAKIGRSKSYVYQRLKLLDLCEEARKAYYAGKLDYSKAVLVARIAGVELQRKALKEITEGHYAGAEPMSFRAAQQHVQNNYMLTLERAPFPIKDANLVAAAGSCDKCPKRTGNTPELFEDVKSGDVCTDPGCFGKKRDAHTAALAAIAKAAGREVITGKDAKKVAPHGVGNELKGYRSLDEQIWSGNKYETLRKLMGKDLPGKPALLEDPANGTLVEVVKAADAAAVLKTKAPSSNPRADTFSAQQRAREAKQRAARELRMQIYLATRDKVAKAGLGLEDVRLVAAEYWERLWHDSKAVIAPWWIPESQDAKGKKVQRHELITTRIATMSGEDLVRLVLDCAAAHLVRNVDGHEATKDGMAIEALAKRHKVDVTAMKRAAVKEAEAKAQAKKAKAKKPAKAKGKR